LEQARASVQALSAHLQEESPKIYRDKSIDIFPESKARVYPEVRGTLVGILSLTSIVVALVLLLACANVAGLLLARFATRQREMGIRRALGASRFRLVRQLLCESLLLSVSAGGLGLLLATWFIPLIQMALPELGLPLQMGIQLMIDVPIDLRVLGFTLAAAILTGLLFGLAPALHASRRDIVSSLREATYGFDGRAPSLRRFLVVGQVALSLLLVVGAFLLVRSLHNLQQVELGYDPGHYLVTGVDLGPQGYDEQRARQFRLSLQARLEQLPQVEAVGFATFIPLSVQSGGSRWVQPEGYEAAPNARPPNVGFNIVSGDYFRTMTIALVRGRVFDVADDGQAPRVAIVNEAFANKYWADEDPIGKRLKTGRWDHEVIGLVKNSKYRNVDEETKPYLYLHMDQLYFRRAATFTYVRTGGDPTNLVSAVRDEVHALDPTLPISYIDTLVAAQAFALAPIRMSAGVVSIFAVLAMLLAAVGLYGVMAYAVRRGARKIGIRMALGANARDVLHQVVREGLILAAIGIAIGAAGSYLLTRLLRAMLYEVSPLDPLSYFMGAMVLGSVAFFASLIPAWRAAKVNPIEVLHEE
jgi:predicted permease